MCGIEKEYKTRGTYTKPMKKNELSFSIYNWEDLSYCRGKGFTFTNEARDLILFQPLNQGYSFSLRV
jgi:hypothetical protein